MIVGFLVVTPGVDYEQWLAYQGTRCHAPFLLLGCAGHGAHAWVGMWTIGTDYIRGHYFGRRATLALYLPAGLPGGALHLRRLGP